jgi:lysophospholipase L1-like esterase
MKRFWLVVVVAAGASLPARAATKVACVGDSITFGLGLPAGRRYTDALSGLLGAGWTVRNFGDSGKTAMKMPAPGNVSYWATTTFADSKSFAPDLVVIMLGTNDSKTANWRGGANTFEADYRALIATFAALPSNPHIQVALPPPALLPSNTVSPQVIAEEIGPILRRVAQETGVGLIDVHGAFAADPRRYFGKGDGKDVGDGLHPNVAGALLIATTVSAALLAPGPDAAAPPEPPLDASSRPEPGPEADATPGPDVEPISVSPDAAAPSPPADAAIPAPPASGCQLDPGRGGPPGLVLLALVLLRGRRRSGRR